MSQSARSIFEFLIFPVLAWIRDAETVSWEGDRFELVRPSYSYSKACAVVSGCDSIFSLLLEMLSFSGSLTACFKDTPLP